jgi:hypothetical protein
MDVSGARLKVERSRQHIADLQEQVARWLSNAPEPEFTQEALDGGLTHVVRLVHVPATPASWSLILGDVLHNLRSALDLLAWQAVIAGGGTPGTKTGFPIYPHNDKNQGDKRVTLALRGANHELVEAIRRLQPYNRCPNREKLRSDALWILHRLNIEDKHHLLVVAATVMGDVSHNVPVEAVGCTVTVTLQPANDGSEVLRYSNLPSPIATVAIEPEGQFDVWVGETEDTAYIEISRLDVLVTQVTAVIDAFERNG